MWKFLPFDWIDWWRPKANPSELRKFTGLSRTYCCLQPLKQFLSNTGHCDQEMPKKRAEKGWEYHVKQDFINREVFRIEDRIHARWRANDGVLEHLTSGVFMGSSLELIPTPRGRLSAPLQAQRISEARVVEPHLIWICLSMNISRSHHKSNLGLLFSFWHTQTQEPIKNLIISTTPYGQPARYVLQPKIPRKHRQWEEAERRFHRGRKGGTSVSNR